MKPAASTSHPGLDTVSGPEARLHEAPECENHVVHSDVQKIFVCLLCWIELCNPVYSVADAMLYDRPSRKTCVETNSQQMLAL